MTVNIYDYANNLESALRKTEEYTSLKATFKTVEEDLEAKALLEKFRAFQVNFYNKLQAGEDLTDEEKAEAQQLQEDALANEKVSQLMQAEQRLNTLIQEVNQIVMKPLEELYNEK